MKRTIAILCFTGLVLATCSCTNTQPTTTTTKSPDGTITVTESLEAMKERLFQERCKQTLEGTGL